MAPQPSLPLLHALHLKNGEFVGRHCSRQPSYKVRLVMTDSTPLRAGAVALMASGCASILFWIPAQTVHVIAARGVRFHECLSTPQNGTALACQA